MSSIKQFLNDLPSSGFMNGLSQYGCGFGAGNAVCSLQSVVYVLNFEQGQPFFELTKRTFNKQFNY